ncbi:MAG: 23S rRNA (pseudouridine(1915)-N(3))-methyltransferase RlmH [Lachnospiraceae bacterium]|nr:23S rRNA (pseudouridine(1915)-N(3))-methyltransferase RlmH [Lachnospiraceae bacterium]MDE6183995.1 23S rRNA (pseudouridine(1915)-N(3))-methyltransferase RlmH [Lachnospiraceae bacterium]MDE7287165.1 23S rRNA (pseudouridine(1915)-N(3))-methyltransferase RlmH [Lachnospiraceae bacterium]
MKKITIICVGKIKEDFYRKAVSEYEKRLGRYCKLEMIQVQDEKTPDDAGWVLEEQIKEKEAARILKHVKEDAYVITLEIKGEKPDSVSFANQLNQLAVQGKSHIQFIIGGSLGLHESVSKAAHRAVSFSNMTFPHQLMRVILLEQIYRSYRIMKGEPYHK